MRNQDVQYGIIFKRAQHWKTFSQKIAPGFWEREKKQSNESLYLGQPQSWQQLASGFLSDFQEDVFERGSVLGLFVEEPVGDVGVRSPAHLEVGLPQPELAAGFTLAALLGVGVKQVGHRAPAWWNEKNWCGFCWESYGCFRLPFEFFEQVFEEGSELVVSSPHGGK